ncbi:MAG TPA: DUF1295 domain-containing protein [Myxococcales bacterium]|jgi:steroid 5-alpha reductase family enzyme
MTDSANAIPTTTSSSSTGLGRALAYVAGAYLFALGIASVVAQALPGMHPLWTLGAADVAATIVVFAFSVAFKNSSFYDPYWSVAPLAIVPYLVMRSELGWSGRAILVAALVSFWGLRLTANWVSGWEGLTHEDWRYVDIAKKAGKLKWPASFGAVHMLPTCMVFMGCFGLYPALVVPKAGFNWIDLVAAAVTLGATLVEMISDLQLHAWSKTKKPGEIMDKGLWRYSRHPNYFGEITFWWGLWLFGVAADPSQALWTFIGPGAMTALFVFASVPMLDKRSLERRPGYAEHMKRTSALIPWPPKTSPRPPPAELEGEPGSARSAPPRS